MVPSWQQHEIWRAGDRLGLGFRVTQCDLVDLGWIPRCRFQCHAPPQPRQWVLAPLGFRREEVWVGCVKTEAWGGEAWMASGWSPLFLDQMWAPLGPGERVLHYCLLPCLATGSGEFYWMKRRKKKFSLILFRLVASCTIGVSEDPRLALVSALAQCQAHRKPLICIY